MLIIPTHLGLSSFMPSAMTAVKKPMSEKTEATANEAKPNTIMRGVNENSSPPTAMLNAHQLRVAHFVLRETEPSMTFA